MGIALPFRQNVAEFLPLFALVGLLLHLLSMISVLVSQSAMEVRKRDVEDIIQYDGQTTEAVSYPIYLNWSLDQSAVTRPSWLSVLFPSTLSRLSTSSSPPTSRLTTRSTSTTYATSPTLTTSSTTPTTVGSSRRPAFITTRTTPSSASRQSTATVKNDRLPATFVYAMAASPFQTTPSTPRFNPLLPFAATTTMPSRTESQSNIHNDSTALPVPVFLSTVLSLPDGEAAVTDSQLLHSLEERLLQLYRLGQSRYNSLIQNSTLPLNLSNLATSNVTVATAVTTLSASPSLQIAQLFLTNSLPNTPRNVSAIFTVRNGTTVVPASEVAQRFALLTSEEIDRVLQATVLQNITVLPAVDGSNGTLSNGSIASPLAVVSAPTNALTSWSMLAAVVALSTVAIVLMTIALVWLLLLIYVKCTKKPSKTGPQNVVVTSESNGVVYIPPPLSGQPLSMDQGIQTVVLPRRATLSRTDRPLSPTLQYPAHYPSSYLNYNTYYTNQAFDDMYAQPAEALPTNGQYAAQFPQRTSAMLPPAKPPRLINEPHTFRKLSKSDRQHSWIATVHPANDIPSDTDKRVRLLSVIKTNRVDPLRLTSSSSVLELQSNGQGPSIPQQPIAPTRRIIQPTADSQTPAASHQVESLGPQEIDPPRTYRRPQRDVPADGSRITSPEGRQEREERRVRERGVNGASRGAPVRPSNPDDMPERVRSPYERTVREIRQEVHMWQKSQTRPIR